MPSALRSLPVAVQTTGNSAGPDMGVTHAPPETGGLVGAETKATREKSEYWRKRAAGKCTQFGCRRKAAKNSVTCSPHRAARRKRDSERERLQYQAKKAAGLCVGKGCKATATEDSLRCSRCVERTRRSQKLHPQSREKLSENQRRHVKRRTDLGLCVQCQRPAVTKTLCQVHREARHAWWRKYSGKPPTTRERCSGCGETGHRVLTCRQRYKLPDINSLATARHPWP